MILTSYQNVSTEEMKMRKKFMFEEKGNFIEYWEETIQVNIS